MTEEHFDKQLESVIKEAAKIKCFCLLVASSVFQDGKLVVSTKKIRSIVTSAGLDPEEFVYGTRELVSNGYVASSPESQGFEITQRGIGLLYNAFGIEKRLGPDDGDNL